MNRAPANAAVPSGSYVPDDGALLDPTRDLYEDLNRAFRFFNERLFKGQLQPSLITLRATGRTLGYFSQGRFVETGTGKRVNEIAFNPEAFAQRGVEDVLSTLVHEMAHQQQFEDGTASRRAYHNKDFEKKMRAVGLVPSATGLPGGPSVGERMTHYIDIDGPFLRVARELIDSQFRIRWADRFSTIEGMSQVVIAAAVESAPARRAKAGEPGERPAPDPIISAAGEVPRSRAPVETLSGIQVPRPQPKPNLSKTKHVCLVCGTSAWGKPSLNLICGDCQQPYTPAV